MLKRTLNRFGAMGFAGFAALLAAFSCGLDKALADEGGVSFWLFRITLTVVLLILFQASGNAQPCNPVIDGTYCASQAIKAPNKPTMSADPQAGGLGAILSSPPGVDEPGTLGAFTFSSDGKRCLGGLLRGVRCS
jgi:hypothetical protein